MTLNFITACPRIPYIHESSCGTGGSRGTGQGQSCIKICVTNRSFGHWPIEIIVTYRHFHWYMRMWQHLPASELLHDQPWVPMWSRQALDGLVHRKGKSRGSFRLHTRWVWWQGHKCGTRERRPNTTKAWHWERFSQRKVFELRRKLWGNFLEEVNWTKTKIPKTCQKNKRINGELYLSRIWSWSWPLLMDLCNSFGKKDTFWVSCRYRPAFSSNQIQGQKPPQNWQPDWDTPNPICMSTQKIRRTFLVGQNMWSRRFVMDSLFAAGQKKLDFHHRDQVEISSSK